MFKKLGIVEREVLIIEMDRKMGYTKMEDMGSGKSQ